VSAQGGRYADTSEKRAQELLAFLEHWLDFDKREHALLWDLIRYELALLTLSMTVPSTRIQSDNQLRDVRATSVPSACGEIVLHEMSCDPRVVGAMLQEKSPRLDQFPASACYFCFWR